MKMWISYWNWGYLSLLNLSLLTVDGRTPANHLGWYWNPVNNGINYCSLNWYVRIFTFPPRCPPRSIVDRCRTSKVTGTINGLTDQMDALKEQFSSEFPGPWQVAKKKNSGKKSTWQFFVTFLGWLSDPFQWLSDLQVGIKGLRLESPGTFFFSSPKVMEAIWGLEVWWISGCQFGVMEWLPFPVPLKTFFCRPPVSTETMIIGGRVDSSR